ncbi:MAG: histidine ammonia-lyase [Candidatus Poseidoniales archaeon]|nr:histidine ammonia-lyase [Candidatus Poseidoniales archaeon]|tara:strand:- start:6515 stop:8050 length:1536 start_codon:yes stop_codon:yes gene_type:complete
MANSVIVLDGNSLTIEELVSIKEITTKVKLSEGSIISIRESRKLVEEIVSSGDVVYGINTGFGALSNVTILPEELEKLQANLIRSHACGVGDYMDPDSVLMMMLVRVNSLAKGNSGARLELIQLLIDMINARISPLIPRIGSLGASGDLAPLSHMTLAMMGESEAEYQTPNGNWTRGESTDILEACSLKPITLQAKEGLSLINGTSQMCSYLCQSIINCEMLIFAADAALATSVEAIKGSYVAFDQRIHDVRPQYGQTVSASRIRGFLNNSEINKSHENCDRVQDSYSFRCAPQVHGPMIDILREARRILTIEINSATDNPLVFSNNGKAEVISGGNFHGQILALTSDNMAVCIHEIASISERRINQVLDPQWSNQKAFLANNEGLDSGLMIVQYVAAAVIAELSLLSNPVTTTNIPVSMGKEDHVSMGATGAFRTFKASKLLSSVISSELICSSQALENIPQKPSSPVALIHLWVRKYVPKLVEDRSTSRDTNIIAEKILSSEFTDIFRK